jgi:O-antigen/teichoic acid export membrane protein
MNKKVLRWNFVFQYGWVITNVVNQILLFPIYMRLIGKDTLGVWVATSSILSWMTLVDPGVGEVLQQKIAELRGKRQSKTEKDDLPLATADDKIEAYEEQSEIGRSIGSGFIASAIILLISIIIGLVCFFAAGTLIDKNIEKYPNLSLALLITIISTGMQLVSFTVSGINQGLHNSAHVAISSLTANFLFLIVNLVFLYMGLGVMSIALANLFRALYINGFNFISLLQLLKREKTPIQYRTSHFKKFIRIFSFTSASKIISGLAGGIDMLVLARFIPPASITLYELNKRPINQANSLIGRHSVALMPLVSHAKGIGDKAFIVNLIYKQFKIYVYIALFAAFMFVINYRDLLILWAGNDTFLGYPILLLLSIYSFTGLVSYFMSNMGYALGDIKFNSKFYIIKNLLFGVLVFFAAKYFGIIGTLYVALGLSLLGDFLYFGYRNYKMGYINGKLMQQSINKWLLIIVICAFASWGCLLFINQFVPENMHLGKLLIGSSLFTLFYLTLVFSLDKDVWKAALAFRNKFLYSPVLKKVKANFGSSKNVVNEEV